MRNESSFNDGFCVVKGVGLAVAISLLGAIIFAVILRNCSLSDKVIYPVNQTMKSVALAVGVLLVTKGEKGWLKGGTIGALYTMVSYLSFSAIGGSFSLSWLIVAELVLAVVTGSVSGIIAVNVKR